MNKVSYFVGGTTMRCRDAAIICEGDDPLEAMVEAAIQTISTDVEITVGNVTMFLAAWRDPDHWSEDWKSIGIDPDDVPDLVVEAIKTS